MPTATANLIPTEESTFNRPGFWDFGGNVEIGGGVILLNADGSYIAKGTLLTPGQKYIVELDLAALNAANLHVGNITTGSGAGPQSKAFAAPGVYTFEIAADNPFFGAIVNGGSAIINSLAVYPAEAYAIPAAVIPAPAHRGKGMWFWLGAAALLYFAARK